MELVWRYTGLATTPTGFAALSDGRAWMDGIETWRAFMIATDRRRGLGRRTLLGTRSDGLDGCWRWRDVPGRDRPPDPWWRRRHQA